MNDHTRAGGMSIGIGAVLVALGVLFLLEQFFGLRLGQVLNIGGLASGIIGPLLLILVGIGLLLRRAIPTAASRAVTAAQAEPTGQVSSPIVATPAAPATAETVELAVAQPSDEQLGAREVAAHQ
jgi:hypothetical protein